MTTIVVKLPVNGGRAGPLDEGLGVEGPRYVTVRKF